MHDSVPQQAHPAFDTLGEEIASAITHGVGTVLSMAGLACWHLFVIGGSVCHYVLIWHYVLPMG
ncbi:MAG: hypothetical protein KF832_03400 [Caldilineaceae bacterium]|nr:hypothetical protein [Caldilineaceae bacterium]